MKQADMLTAAFRQFTSAKTGGKGGANGAVHAKDAKDKAEHFREQMRNVAKNSTSAVSRPETGNVEKPGAAILDAGVILAELAGGATSKQVFKERPEQEEDTSNADGNHATAETNDGCDANVALSVVMAKLDQAQPNVGREIKASTQPAALKVDLALKDQSASLQDFDGSADIGRTDTDLSNTPRFTASLETHDTKPVAATKAVVREQETHFEPVQQITTLQKIVDRMASDLPAVTMPEGTHAAETSLQDSPKLGESRPVRMMTLELDPPNLGSVTIKMRLAGDSVEVHLTADRLETTHLLRQERGALSDAMQSAGYSFDIAGIDHTRTPDSSANGGQSQPQQQQASSDQRGASQSSGNAQSDSGSSGRFSGDGQGGARQNRQDHDQPHALTERQQDQGGRPIRSSTVYI